MVSQASGSLVSCYEFRKTLEEERIIWLEGHCVAQGQNTPYLPILEILRTNFQIEDGDTSYADRLAEWRDWLAYHVVRGEVWSKAPAYFHLSIMNVSLCLEASLWWQGEHERAVELGHHEITIAAEFKNFGLQIWAHFYLGQGYHAMGDYPQAIDFLRRSVASLEGDLQRERFDMPGLASVLSRSWLVWCLAEQGRFSEGLTYGEEALQIAENVDHRYSLIVACLGLGVLYLQTGEPQSAIAVLERGVALSQAERLPQLFPLVAGPLGAAYTLTGRVAEATPLLEEAVERAATMNFMGIQSRRLAWLGEAYLLAGRIDEAMPLAMRALDLARAHKERGHEAWSLRLLGEVYGQQHTPALEPAEAVYRQALALAAELGMAPLQAHSHLGLGLLYARSRRPQEASAALSAAVDLLRTMEMRHWLPSAETALAQVLT